MGSILSTLSYHPNTSISDIKYVIELAHKSANSKYINYADLLNITIPEKINFQTVIVCNKKVCVVYDKYNYTKNNTSIIDLIKADKFTDAANVILTYEQWINYYHLYNKFYQHTSQY